MPASQQQTYKNGVISFFAFIFTIFVVLFILGDFVDYLWKIDSSIKQYIYIAITIIEYIFAFLLKGNRVGSSAFFAVTIITGGIVIPFQMLEYFSGWYVYGFYIVSSLVVLTQIQNIGQKIAGLWKVKKLDVITAILLFLMIPSMFAHFAAFVGAREKLN